MAKKWQPRQTPRSNAIQRNRRARPTVIHNTALDVTIEHIDPIIERRAETKI